MTSLARNLIEVARRHPDSVALRLDEIEVPYAGLEAASARLAGLLAARDCVPAIGSASCCPMFPTSPSRTTACCGPAGWSCP